MSDKPRYVPYHHPGGGWGALNATARAMMKQSVLTKDSVAILSMNKLDGFKCPSCAWPDPDKPKPIEFCENGAKALANETTRRRVTREFFAEHPVSSLQDWDDYTLELQGRLTEPMRYDPRTDHYVPCTWDDAFAIIGKHLRRLKSPDEAEFYTSGRTPNEAAFLYSVFVRAFGTNNFPDCSNMCHEPTSRGLPPAIGVGKGTVVMSDFDMTEAIFIVGQNTGTNSPRMMTNLVEARKRNVPIVVVNPLPERALIRFQEPQNPVQMATFGSDAIATEFVHIRSGGDMAFFKGMMKALFEREAAGDNVLDRAFIAEHTNGLDDFRQEIEALNWEEICAVSGIGEEQIRRVADIYAKSSATILCFGMGATQHQKGSNLLQQLAAFLMLRGNYGKPGAGLCPVRGHSNVQGDRTVGIDEQPSEALLDRVKEVFGFEPPRDHGHDVIAAVKAMIAGEVKVFFGMGGNFIRAVPDTERAYEAMSRLDLSVCVSTKLNRSHVVHGREALILPIISRSEKIVTSAGEQFVTIEDAMANVSSSRGVLEPASPHLCSEVEVICRMARATLPDSAIPWESYIEDYDLIRDRIAEVYPELYADFNARIKKEKRFLLYVAARHRVWNTPTGKANFIRFDGVHVNDLVDDPGMFRLSTMRSHDQYNTTIYSRSDRYRGVYNDRMVIFMNEDDMKERGLETGSKICLKTIATDGIRREVSGLSVVKYPTPRGSLAGYYPELNPLLPLNHFDQIIGTPAAKSIPVRVELAA